MLFYPSASSIIYISLLFEFCMKKNEKSSFLQGQISAVTHLYIIYWLSVLLP